MENILVVAALREEIDHPFFKDKNVLITGMGKINATFQLTKYLALLSKLPDLILHFGTAGGNHSGVFQINRFYSNDLQDWPASKRFHRPYPYFSHDFPGEDLIPNVGMRWCLSGDRFFTKEEMRRVDSIFVFDMEAYAIKTVCNLFEVNHQCVKIVTDSGNMEDWEKNVNTGAEKFVEVYQYFAGRENSSQAV